MPRPPTPRGHQASIGVIGTGFGGADRPSQPSACGVGEGCSWVARASYPATSVTCLAPSVPIAVLGKRHAHTVCPRFPVSPSVERRSQWASGGIGRVQSSSLRSRSYAVRNRWADVPRSDTAVRPYLTEYSAHPCAGNRIDRRSDACRRRPLQSSCAACLPEV